MKRYCLLIIPLISFLLVSCGKNGAFPSTPRLTFKSISPSQVAASDTNIQVSIVCGFRDGQGDISGPVYFMQSNNASAGFDSTYTLPSLPAQNNMQGNLILQLSSNDILFPVSSGTDTVSFYLFIKDAAGHSSDTIQTSRIMLTTN